MSYLERSLNKMLKIKNSKLEAKEKEYEVELLESVDQINIFINGAYVANIEELTTDELRINLSPNTINNGGKSNNFYSISIPKDYVSKIE